MAPAKEPHLTKPFCPPQFISVPHDNGVNESHQLFQAIDQNDTRKFLQCRICLRMIGFAKSFYPFLTHRDSKECKKWQARIVEDQIREEARQALFSCGLVTPGPVGQSVQSGAQTSPQPTSAEASTSGVESTAAEPSEPRPASPPAMGCLPPPPSDVPQPRFISAPVPVVYPILPPPPSRPMAPMPGPSSVHWQPGPAFVFAPNPCHGQPFEWTAGPIWDTYPFQLHSLDETRWKPIGFLDGNRIILRSKSCRAQLSTEREQRTRICSKCSSLLSLAALHQWAERASKPANPNTPYRYLSHKQLAEVLHEGDKKRRASTSTVNKQKRTIMRLSAKVNEENATQST